MRRSPGPPCSSRRIPSSKRLRRATGGPAERTFATLVGLELRPRRLREAAAIWQGLTEARGVQGRDAIWAHPDLLPTAEDFDDPDGFVTGRPELDISDLDPGMPDASGDPAGGPSGETAEHAAGEQDGPPPPEDPKPPREPPPEVPPSEGEEVPAVGLPGSRTPASRLAVLPSSRVAPLRAPAAPCQPGADDPFPDPAPCCRTSLPAAGGRPDCRHEL